MRTLIIQPGVTACQVEMPEDIERSREGSLHIRPGSTITITDDELAHLCEARPDLVDKATLVGGTPKPSPKPEAKKPAPVSSGSETHKDEDKGDEPEVLKGDEPEASKDDESKDDESKDNESKDNKGSKKPKSKSKGK